MINIVRGNLLQEQSEAIINTVNCVGVMGKGIALQFKKTYPDNFKAYAAACKNGEVVPGKMFIFDCGVLSVPRYIINFPTKRHWKMKSDIADIKNGLESLAKDLARLKISSVSIPPLGCGNGGLDWAEVKNLIYQHLGRLENIEIRLFPPSDAPIEIANPIKTKAPKLTKLKAVLLKMINLYQKSASGYSVTRLEIQKLAYFLHESGTGWDNLNFQKWYYGPYSLGLEHMLHDMDSHWITGCGDNSKPFTPINIKPESIGVVDSFLNSLEDSGLLSEQIQHVLNLTDGFETPYSIELLASVHYAATHNSNLALCPEDVLSIFKIWNQHKQQFTLHQITQCWNQLENLGWIMR